MTATKKTLGERKIDLIKCLRKFKAVGSSSARPLSVLAEKTGYDRREVYGMINGLSGKAGSSPTCLSATKHVAISDLPEKELSVYLTPSGRSTTFKDMPFERSNGE